MEADEQLMHEIKIEHFEIGMSVTTPEEMAKLSGASFLIAGRVPDAEGEAFDLYQWYAAWMRDNNSENAAASKTPSYLIVEAADSFEATIPWEQLEQAAVLYRINGLPLQKAGPIRLYVPNGSSKCLNVKSIVKLKIGHDEPNTQVEAAYGFKHTFSMNDLRNNK
ncbi:hypothetical protein MHH56_23395 [Paenibacillus sp. FSL K6-3182]|uniref:hypothetical protein n=2 Tax=unclassified Paenibacillus TaxID=185978 RepID=UPI0030D14517